MKGKKYIIAAVAAILAAFPMDAMENGVDTVWVSSKYTTHILLPTDLIYADLSNKEDLIAGYSEQSKNLVGVIAKGPFTKPCNLTLMESNGMIRSYILLYRENPETLVIDEKNGIYDSEPETVYVSSLFSTHMVFSSDVVYSDFSNFDLVTVENPEASLNILAVKALSDFGRQTLSATVLEANGSLHSYVLRYQEHPESLVLDMQRGGESGNGKVVSVLRKGDAPLLSDVLDYRQQLYHIASRKERITLVCENIFSYSDITYVILRIENRGGVSFQAENPSFVVCSQNKKKKLTEEAVYLPKSTVGSLSAAPDQSSKIAFSFDKITLSANQVFRICIYELNGRREFILTLSPNDVNMAVRPDNVR